MNGTEQESAMASSQSKYTSIDGRRGYLCQGGDDRHDDNSLLFVIVPRQLCSLDMGILERCLGNKQKWRNLEGNIILFL